VAERGGRFRVDTSPVAPNDTPEGRTKNGRIEIRMRPVVVEEKR